MYLNRRNLLMIDGSLAMARRKVRTISSTRSATTGTASQRAGRLGKMLAPASQTIS